MTRTSWNFSILTPSELRIAFFKKKLHEFLIIFHQFTKNSLEISWFYKTTLGESVPVCPDSTPNPIWRTAASEDMDRWPATKTTMKIMKKNGTEIGWGIIFHPFSNDSWMYPYQGTPMGNPLGYNPQESLKNTINTINTLFGPLGYTQLSLHISKFLNNDKYKKGHLRRRS